MRTFPTLDTQSGHLAAFEIDNAYISLSSIENILVAIPDVSCMRRRKLFSDWKDIHIWFNFKGTAHVVLEQFGDNSRYWIGPELEVLPSGDIEILEAAFKSYAPPIYRQLLGDVLSLRFFKRD